MTIMFQVGRLKVETIKLMIIFFCFNHFDFVFGRWPSGFIEVSTIPFPVKSTKTHTRTNTYTLPKLNESLAPEKSPYPNKNGSSSNHDFQGLC